MQLKFIAVASFLAITGVCASQIDVHSLRTKAQHGDTASQYALAVMYENNAQNVPDWNEAAWWYRHAAEQGDVDAQRRLAWCYENGKGVNLDFDKALKWYLKAAEHGDSISQFQVGRFYKDISQDYEKSFSWYCRASESGYPPAVNAVGECYRDGFGVPQNHYSAIGWFRKAADMNDPDANYNLGRAYQLGFGVDENVAAARSYYEEALRLGHPSAASALDRMRFRIVGDIKGLVKGDTLYFQRIPLDGTVYSDLPSGFRIVVGESGRFEYEGIQNHAQYYRMVYASAHGRYDDFVSDGLRILVEHGEYVIRGDVSDIYLASISGGDYDDALISAALKSGGELSKRESGLRKDIAKARKKGDSGKVSLLESALADFMLDNAARRDSIRRNIEKFKILYPSSTFTIVDYLENFSDYPVDDLREAYNSLDSAAVDSYYGKILIDNIMKMERVGVGCRMPFFALVSSWHQPVSLNNLLGKYSLIYFWDTEAASRKVDPDVVRLVERYPEKIEVVGIPPSEKPLEQVRVVDKYSSLLRHKWKDCEFTASNRASIEQMALGAAPYFILISPDGEILDRGQASVLANLTSMLGE